MFCNNKDVYYGTSWAREINPTDIFLEDAMQIYYPNTAKNPS